MTPVIIAKVNRIFVFIIFFLWFVYLFLQLLNSLKCRIKYFIYGQKSDMGIRGRGMLKRMDRLLLMRRFSRGQNPRNVCGIIKLPQA